MSSMAPTMYNEIDITKFSFTELKENKYAKGQKNAFVEKYHHPLKGDINGLNFYIQFPWLELFTYGIPKIGDYIKSDSERLYIKCPLDLSNPEINNLYENFIVKLDNLLSSDEFKNKLFGKKASKYEYNPIFKTPKIIDDDDDDDDNKDKKSNAKPPFIKLKFKTTPEYNIKETIFRDSNKEIIKDINTISEVEKIICWKCEFRPMIRLSKIWAQSVGTGKSGPGYGATIIIEQIQVKPPLYNNLLSNKNHEYTFIDNDNKIKLNKKQPIDSESDSEKEKISKKPTPILDSDDESDDEQLDMKSQVLERNAKHLSEQPIKKPIQIESDNESDEEIKPTKNKKQIKQQKIESDSEEEIKPVKNKKNIKKNK